MDRLKELTEKLKAELKNSAYFRVTNEFNALSERNNTGARLWSGKTTDCTTITDNVFCLSFKDGTCVHEKNRINEIVLASIGEMVALGAQGIEPFTKIYELGCNLNLSDKVRHALIKCAYTNVEETCLEPYDEENGDWDYFANGNPPTNEQAKAVGLSQIILNLLDEDCRNCSMGDAYAIKLIWDLFKVDLHKYINED